MNISCSKIKRLNQWQEVVSNSKILKPQLATKYTQILNEKVIELEIIITGPTCCGKRPISKKLSEYLNIAFYETDTIIEELYQAEHGRLLPFQEIYKLVGEQGFRAYERQAVEKITSLDWCVVSPGGSTLLNPDSRRLLRQNSIMVLLKADPTLLWDRLEKMGTSKYLRMPSPQKSFEEHVGMVMEVLEPFADVVVDISSEQDVLQAVICQLTAHLAVYSKSPNTLGDIVRLTTFGESHGPALGAILDGVKPGIELSVDDIQKELDRRRPGQSKVSTPRNEPDRIRILSGVFEGKTTGTPIALVIENQDQDSSKYDMIRNLLRPGHADFTFWKKYGIRDHRGGGRSSGRETAGRVAGGAIAKKILKERGVEIIAFSREIAGIKAESLDFNTIEDNSVRCPDPKAAEKMQQAILDARTECDSVGGIAELRIKGLPAGLGDPVFGKLDARLAGAFCSLGAVKAIEFGDGLESAKMRGSEFNDQMKDGQFLTNHAGGILGGISSGQEIIIRLSVKPTPSILKPQQTSDLDGKNHQMQVEGRHDPCIVPRIIPVVEAMAALVLLDAWEIQERLNK